MGNPLGAILLALSMAFFVCDAGAVVIGSNSFNTVAPTSADIAGWNSGWAGSEDTGWNYVGTVGGASGVYLGDGWVLTAGHVPVGTFTLAGMHYSAVPGSTDTFTNSYGTADLSLFRIASSPNLPALTLATTTQVGDSVVMIGYGGGHGETWGVNSIAQVEVPVTPEGFSYVSLDFETDYSSSGGNLISGDSGGGDFYYDTSTNQWVLAGINEAIDDSGDSYMVELSDYASQINAVVPEPSTWTLLASGIGLLWACSRLTPKGNRPLAV